MENTSILMYISHSDGFFLWAHGQGRATCCQIRFRAMGRLAKLVKIRPEKSGVWMCGKPMFQYTLW